MTNDPVTKTTQTRNPKPAEFIAALTKLDAGGLARLRRNAGHTLAEAADAHRVFFQALPYGISTFQEETYFMVATLFAFTRPEDRSPTAGSLGATLRKVRGRSDSKDDRANSLDHRFQALINSDQEQLPFRLRQIVRLTRAKGQRIDFVQLLTDVLWWDGPEKRVQLRWSRDYYVGPQRPDPATDAPPSAQLEAQT